MMKFSKLLIVFLCCLMFVGCTSSSNNEQVKEDDETIVSSTQEQGDTNMNQFTLTINSKDFTVTLEDNDTVKELLQQIPMTLSMSDLNSNEKYANLKNRITSNPQSVRNIEAGDVMLFGDSCLVLFYKSFSTSYTYTRIGHVDNVEEFVETVGSRDITVSIH